MAAYNDGEIDSEPEEISVHSQMSNIDRVKLGRTKEDIAGFRGDPASVGLRQHGGDIMLRPK